MHLERISLAVIATLAVSSAAFAQANQPPVVSTGGNSGVDYAVDCNNVFAPFSATTSVQLDGSGSYDPNGTPVTFFWHNECQNGWFDDPTSPAPVYHVDMTGVCQRECWIALRVTSGGQTSVKGFRVIVSDATPPQLTIPGPVIAVHGDPVTVGATGSAVAIDNCDPAPIVTYSDVTIDPTGPGQPEQTIERTWTVVDCAGHQSTAVQTILVLAPTGFGQERANLDFMPGACPNVYAPLPTGTVDALLLGVASFKADKLDKPSVRMFLRTNPTISIVPSGFLTKDLGSRTAAIYGDCNDGALDGFKDVRIRFQRSAVNSLFVQNGIQSGQTVEVVIMGRLKGGKLFATRDVVTLQ